MCQMIQSEMKQEVHHHEASSYIMSNMTQPAVPQVCGTCGIQLTSFKAFSISVMDVCFPFKINNKEPTHNRRMVIEYIIHINRTSVVLGFKGITIP